MSFLRKIYILNFLDLICSLLHFAAYIAPYVCIACVCIADFCNQNVYKCACIFGILKYVFIHMYVDICMYFVLLASFVVLSYTAVNPKSIKVSMTKNKTNH